MSDFPIPYNDSMLPPQNADAERTLLGQCIADGRRYFLVADSIRSDMFYIQQYSTCWKALELLSVHFKKFTLIEVVNKLREMGELDDLGGPVFVAQLSNVGFFDDPVSLADMIITSFIAREAIRIQNDSIRALYNDTEPILPAITTSSMELTRLLLKRDNRRRTSLTEAAMENVNLIRELSERPNELPGLSTGFKDIDEHFGGLQDDRLIIMAARPGMGKTAFVLKLGLNVAKNGHRVAFFSLEMSKRQLVNRMLSLETGVESEKINKNRIKISEIELLEEAAKGFDTLDFIIDDTPSLGINELAAKVQAIGLEKPVELVIVDYLQLMKGDGSRGNRENEVSAISRGLKELSKLVGIPVIALSQLNRDVETRGGDKQPKLSDLRESGSLEQDADIVAFLYRYWYYGIERLDNGTDTKDMALFLIRKNRDGALENVMLRWDETTTNFTDYYNFKPKEEGSDLVSFLPSDNFNDDLELPDF